MSRDYNPNDPLGFNGRRSDRRERRQGRIFHTIVVADFISNPASLPPEALRSLKQSGGVVKGVLNSQFISKMPRNSILGYRVSDGNGEYGKLEIFYPFFSPHICLPVKPGEQVWVVYERLSTGTLGYWMTRKCVDLQVDDLNYTHADRISQNSRDSGTKLTETLDVPGDGASDQVRVPRFPNGTLSTSQQRTLRGKRPYLDILRKSTALGNLSTTNQFIGEPVPRVPKEVGDLILQGSNNTSIVLGTEIGKTGVNPKGPFPKSMFDPGQGAIDICAGRGQTKNTSAAFREGGIINERGYNEISKNPGRELLRGSENISEGLASFSNDLSRIYLSMKTSADDKFEIDIEGMDRSDGDLPAIVLKSDQVRLVARDDLKIVVGAGTTGASVILKSDGNIVFIPGPEGVIKLGGDDADKAILAAPSAKTVQTGGEISIPVSLVTSAGGSVGVPDDQGVATSMNLSTFATKVLIK